MLGRRITAPPPSTDARQASLVALEEDLGRGFRGRLRAFESRESLSIEAREEILGPLESNFERALEVRPELNRDASVPSSGSARGRHAVSREMVVAPWHRSFATERVREVPATPRFNHTGLRAAVRSERVRWAWIGKYLSFRLRSASTPQPTSSNLDEVGRQRRADPSRAPARRADTAHAGARRSCTSNPNGTTERFEPPGAGRGSTEDCKGDRVPSREGPRAPGSYRSNQARRGRCARRRSRRRSARGYGGSRS
jgi:hypothetical protein